MAEGALAYVRAARGFRRLTASLSWLSGLGIMLLMVPTVIDVSYRYFIGASVPGMVEYSEVGLVFVVYLGIAYAQQEGAHIATPIVTARLSPRNGELLRVFGRVLLLLLLAFAFWRTAIVAIDATEIREFRMGSVSVPTWPARIVVAMGFLLIVIEVALDIFERLRALAQGQILGQPYTEVQP